MNDQESENQVVDGNLVGEQGHHLFSVIKYT